MRRFLPIIIAVLLASAVLSGVVAQGEPRLKAGDPPVASQITVSAPDADGMVTVSGAAGSVFPAAEVAVRNLYTGDTVYALAGLTGTFTATLYGPGNTPFEISPAQNIPTSLRNQPGALPGGPATIVYGAFPSNSTQNGNVTQLVMDGDASDWDAYKTSALVTSSQPVISAFANSNSIYVALLPPNIPTGYAQVVITLSLDGNTYDVAFDPAQSNGALLRRVKPNPLDIGSLAVTAGAGEAIEVRIPRLAINPTNPLPARTQLDGVRFLNADGSEVLAVSAQAEVPVLDEVDGVVRLNSQIGQEFVRFTTSGTLGGGSGRWRANGRINSLALKPGDALALELDIEMDAANLPAGLVGLSMLGKLRLQPVVGADSRQAAGGVGSSNGWSSLMTASELPISNVRGDFGLAETSTPANVLIRQNNKVIFPLDFSLKLPSDLPDGLYVPLLQGFGQVGDGNVFAWEADSPFGVGAAATDQKLTRLPIALNIGSIASGHLLWTLFQDAASEGSRGVVAEEDQAHYGLWNTVRYNSPTIILPLNRNGNPISYPLEPYLLNQLPNAYDSSAPPLVPFLFPGGRLSVQVTGPDGQVNDLGSSVILQNQMSTPTLDERQRFGAQSQLDIYRLTTLNPAFTAFTFPGYGEYSIAMKGNLEDVWGNHYEGGGSYQVLIAEPLALHPAVLPGTPFEVGNVFQPGLWLEPGVPAQVTTHLRFYPLDGSKMVEYHVEGQANPNGYYAPSEAPFTFEEAGEYVVDYEVRFTDADGRLWAGSLRGAGVIATPNRALVAHGARGLQNDADSVPQAWYIMRQYAPNAVNPRLNIPYNSGDVLWIPDGSSGQLKPTITVQDVAGDYARWLVAGETDATGANSMMVEQSLPVTLMDGGNAPYGLGLQPEKIANNAYTYFSAVTPAVSARQFVEGSHDGGLDTYLDMNDPYNGQAGAGVAGSSPGDFLFLFGGAVIRNADANITQTAIYGSLGVVIDGANDPLGARVLPPFQGQAGGANSGPLFSLRGQPINMFFHPTAIRPGSVLRVGDRLSVAGQMAPTLPSRISVSISRPDGEVFSQYEGQANAVGYYYDPAQDLVVDQPGLWTVDIHIRHDGLTSVGKVEPPPPTGDVLGSAGGRFNVYVLPADTQPLEWNDNRSDITIPAAQPYNFRFSIPSGWDDVQVYHSITTAGMILEEGPLRPSGTQFNYQYNLRAFHDIFPNIEQGGQGEGSSAADTITLTFVVIGTDDAGNPAIRSRTFTIAFDRLLTFG
ncbi:MAG: hypothetical protein R3E39_18725 [Anaerolineae bacterium]